MGKKVKCKKYLVFGDFPNSGGWGDFTVDHSTMRDAKMEAFFWLKDGYEVFILNQETQEQWEVRLKK